MKRVRQVMVASVSVLVVATVSLAQMGWQTFRDQDGNVLMECTTMGSQTVCRERDTRPRLARMISGSSADHLIGERLVVAHKAMGFASVEVAMILARAGQADVETFNAIYKPLKAAGLAMMPIAGLRVEILATADYYKSPLVQVREVDTREHETYWIPLMNLAEP